MMAAGKLQKNCCFTRDFGPGEMVRVFGAAANVYNSMGSKG